MAEYLAIDPKVCCYGCQIADNGVVFTDKVCQFLQRFMAYKRSHVS